MMSIALGSHAAAAAEPLRPLTLKVMTFNLKFAGEERGPHRWSLRRPLVRDAIRAQDPDLIGTQEGLDGQLREIAADLPEYAWSGVGREGGQRGEYSAVFYKKERFRLLDQGNFWLSSTPEVAGSRSWGNILPRMATWVLLEDRVSGDRFYHFNTHFDHLIAHSRTKSAELLVRRIAGRKLPVPVILTGDFNSDQYGTPHNVLVGAQPAATGLIDTWNTAQAREGQLLSTFHNWKGPGNGGKHIDWILSTPDFVSRRARVVTFSEGGQWPSDHFPVVSELTLGTAAQPLVAEKPVRATTAVR